MNNRLFPLRDQFLIDTRLTASLAIALVLAPAASHCHAQQDSPGQAKPIQPATDAPQPMTPGQSAARVKLPDGFRLELVASEPLVQDPSCIAFDERGRMFVCELHGYNIEGHIDVTELNKSGVLDKEVRRIRWELQGGEIADKAVEQQFGVVKLLTDTDGDGVMDKSDVWADDLPACYGIVPARGGVLVTCAPDIVFLADRDGDGKPEVRETLFTGFRKHVMERGINNPRWGLDNWIYVGAGGDGGTIAGPHLSNPVELRHSDFRIKPDGSAIEPVNGRVGTFGMTINEVGDRFPAGGGRPAIYALPLPLRYLTRNPSVATPETNHAAAHYNRGYRISRPHPWRVRRRQDPAWVKFYGRQETDSNYFSGGCSNEFYGDALFPPQYRGNIFYCEPSLNIVHRCVLNRDGAGYRAERAAEEQESEFLASTDQWFRPMNLRVGPDGTLYIVDMYREIIEDYSAIPRFLQQQYGLDHGGDYGRIWRLVPHGFVGKPWEDLTGLDVDQLARVTADGNAWRRLTAQRLLIERQQIAAVEILRDQILHSETPQAKIHALHTLDGLGKLRASDVSPALIDRHYGVRLHGLRLSSQWLDSDPQLLGRVVAMSGDNDPSVLLQLAMTLGESSDPKMVDVLLALAVKHGAERWMPSAILSSSGECAEELLAKLLRQPNLSKQARPLLRPLSATIAGRRDANEMSRVLASCASRDDEITRECLAGIDDGLAGATFADLPSADGWASLSRLLDCESKEVRDLATRLAAKLPIADDRQLQTIFENNAKLALDETRSLNQREQAMAVLASAPYDVIAKAAARLLRPDQPASLQLATVSSLSASADNRVGGTLLAQWSSYTPTIRGAVMNAMFVRSGRLPALLDAIAKGTIGRGELNALEREQLITSDDRKISERAKRLLSASAADAELQRRMAKYQAALKARRDLERGKQVFVKHCLACHKLGDQGYEVGPPLGSVAGKPDEAILLDLLDPSGRIEPEYRSYIVATRDGRTFSGVLASESPTSITLRKEKGAGETILRRDIDRFQASSVSLMPSDMYRQIGPQEAANLIAFLRHAYGRKR